MRALCLNEQLVHCRDRNVSHHAQVDAKPDARQQVHGLFRIDAASTCQNAHRSSNLIIQLRTIVTQQQVSNPTFIAEDVGDNVSQIVQQVLLAAAQRMRMPLSLSASTKLWGT